jgi:hypothetical protein
MNREAKGAIKSSFRGELKVLTKGAHNNKKVKMSKEDELGGSLYKNKECINTYVYTVEYINNRATNLGCY